MLINTMKTFRRLRNRSDSIGSCFENKELKTMRISGGGALQVEERSRGNTLKWSVFCTVEAYEGHVAGMERAREVIQGDEGSNVKKGRA